MWRTMLEKRGLLVLAWAAGVGIFGIRTYPVPTDNVLLEMIALRTPHVFQVLVYGYATLWFTTPLIIGALATSIIAIVVFRHGVTPRQHPLPPYPPPETRPTPSLVLGETHFATSPGRAPAPTWLTIPQRGLYCGVMVVGATGTGKTSACMYPYIDQLLRWRADDPERKIGGLVMDVKGDFGPQVSTMLERAGRRSDYLEVGIGSPFCYNPLHNDLDPYAVAYAIAALLNNLYGKSKEPFWQQAYTDVMRSAIAMRRLTEGYTTLADVYRLVSGPHVRAATGPSLSRLVAPADIAGRCYDRRVRLAIEHCVGLSSPRSKRWASNTRLNVCGRNGRTMTDCTAS